MRVGSRARHALDFLGFDLTEMLPAKGGFVCMLKAYFDESGRDDGTFYVAGLVFSPGQARRFQEEWQAMLPDGRPFHMTDVINRKGDFRNDTPEELEALQKRAVEIVAKRARLGAVVACNRKDMKPILPSVRGFDHVYPLCAHVCLAAIGRWLDQRKRRDVVSYLFEQGHKKQGDADALMHLVRRDTTLRRAYHYHSHGFAGKRDALALQAADLLAWEYGRFKSHYLDGGTEKLRDTFVALTMAKRLDYVAHHLGPDSVPVQEYLARIDAYARKVDPGC